MKRIRRGDRMRLTVERVIAMRAVTDVRFRLVVRIAETFRVPARMIVGVDLNDPRSGPR